MNIVLATEVIHPGGAETFVLRLARSFKDAGHRVTIFIFYKDYFNKDFYELSAKGVDYRFAAIPFPIVLRKLDTLFMRLKIDLSVRNWFIKRSLKALLDSEPVDVIHSHLFKTDYLCTSIAKGNQVPVVSTIHGDYLQFYYKHQIGEYIPLLNYFRKTLHNLTSLSRVVCITEKQKQFFEDKFGEASRNKLIKIYNGYSAAEGNSYESLRSDLGIGESDFIFGMVSRGIPEKGWYLAIRAFQKLEDKSIYLVLVGDSSYLRELKEKYHADPRIHFIGHSDSPLSWIKIFNVGLLPTTYSSESLPTAIIEYLCCDVPVIASDAGDISRMIEVDGCKAGIVLPIVSNNVSENDLVAAMSAYVSDGKLYARHKLGASRCYRQFDMGLCTGKYLSVYETAKVGSGTKVSKIDAFETYEVLT